MNRFQKLLIFLFSSFILLCHLQYTFRGETKCQNETGISVQDQGPKIETICSGESLAKCVPPFVKFRQQYRTSVKHSLTACAIEKNFSTFLTAIMCYLNDPQRFLEANRTLDRDIYDSRLCKTLNEFNELKKVPNYAKTKLFTVVRDPIDRFVSGFVDKCLRERTWEKHHHRCGGCQTNITCFINVMYTRMMNYSKRVSRSVFFDDSHFFPQSWRCEFAQLISRYKILKLDDPAFFDRILDLLAERGADDKALIYINQSLQQKTAHSTQNSSEREKIEKLVKSSKWMMTKLVQMYYFDFLLFGYSLPNL